MLARFSRFVAPHGKLLRNFHASSLLSLKKIVVEKKDANTTVIDCRYIPSPREKFLLKFDRQDGKCPLCSLKLNLKHTDVLILCQYLDSCGKILRRKDTSLCEQQYKLVKELIYMAQYAGLLPEPPRQEPKKPYQLLNTYYDESTITVRPKKKKFHLRFYYLGKRLGPIEKFRIKPSIGSHYGPVLN